VSKIVVQYTQIGTYRVRYEVVGEGDPVVLVHGLSASTLWWRRNAPVLARQYRVYLVDLPGFGAMHFPRSRFVLEQAVAWLLRWMEAVGLHKVHLIGHSMGGHICLRLAASYPELVSRLVLVAPAIIPRTNTVAGYLVPLLTGARHTSPSFFGTLLYDALRANPLTLFQATRDLIALDGHAAMKQVQAPTLLLWGEYDTLVPATFAPLVRQEIPEAHLHILVGAGHVCMFDRPHEFNGAVLTFLQSEEV
jgi:pimeloyl-ACP methyl ester carboxylesterase